MSLWNAITKKRARSLRQPRKLTLEPLEERRVMSVSIALSNGGTVLNITGNGASDTVELYEMRSNPASPVADLLQVSWKDNLGSGKWEGKVAPLSKIVFNGNGGHDVLRNVYNPTGSPKFQHPTYRTLVYSILPTIEAHGGPGNDTLYGGPKGDKLYGDDGYDKLWGGAGDDKLWGGAADDTLDGGIGADRLEGGAGNDVLVGGDQDDTYVFAGRSLGSDTISDLQGSNTLDFNGMAQGVNVDLLDPYYGPYSPQCINSQLGLNMAPWLAAVDNVIGTEFNDFISGNNKANRLEGRGGQDTLEGGLGEDTLEGGTGADRLEGGPGNDVLVGGDQDDTYVFAGPENLGIDTISDLQGSNTLDFNRMAQGVNVALLDPYYGPYTPQCINSQLGLSMGPWFAAVHNVIGTEFDDTISGNSKANRLEGRGGRDTLEGGAGSDVLVGGDQDDTYVFAGPGDLGIDSIVDLQGSNTLDFSRMAQGVNVDLLDPYSGSYTAQKINSQLSLSMGPWFAAVDNVIGTEFDDTISGNSKANRLEGRGGRDTLLGKSGSDQLLGGTGDDTLEGGPGEDTLEGGTDNDRYRFTGAADLGSDTVIDPSNVKTGGFDSQGMETDELDFGGLAQGITFDLSKPNEVQQVNTLLKLKFSGAIDNVMGTDLDDVITGNSLSNRIEGRKGNDVLRGQAGDDFLYGGDGNDRLYGGDGTDQMYGEGDDDILVAIDGTTSDILYGGSGRNNLWFDSDPAGWGQDSVKDSYAGASGSIGCPMPSPNLHSVKSFANGADKTLDGDNLADPTDGASNGAWYVDYRNQPLFATTGPSQRDVRQGAVGDCWLLATLAANARMNPNSIHKVVVDLGDGTYAVQLGYSYYRVDADLPNEWPQGATVADFRYAHLGEQGSLWVAIVEKAYAFHRGAGTYASLKTGCADEAMNALPSTTFSESDNFGGAQDALNYIASHFNLGQAVVVAINEPGAAAPLVGPHSYSVEQVNYQTTSSGVKTPVSVVLRNPWGYDGAGNDADTKDGLVTVTGEQLVASMFGSASWDWRDSIYCAFVS